MKNNSDFAGLAAHFDLAATCSQQLFGNDESAHRRAYLVAGPIVLTLGLCGNFAIIAVLSKHRFRPFPITTLIKSHAITNIFCLFVGLFIGDYFRALSNFDVQQQFGTWGCRIHLTLSFALRCVTSWHYALISGFRLIMATSPSFYTSRSSRLLVRGAITIIVVSAIVLSSHIFWSLAFQPITTIPKSNVTSTSGEAGHHNNQTKSICRPPCTESFYWHIFDLTSSVIIPLGLVLVNTITIPLVIYRQAISNGTDTNNIMPFSPPIPKIPSLPSYHNNNDDSSVSSANYYYSQRRSSRHRTRRSSTIEIMASNLAAMLYYQDIIFLTLSVPLLIYYLLMYFPPSPLTCLPFLNDANQIEGMIELLHYLHPFAKLLQYSTNVVLFPVFALCQSRRPGCSRRNLAKTKPVNKLSSSSAKSVMIAKSVSDGGGLVAGSAAAMTSASQLQSLMGAPPTSGGGGGGEEDTWSTTSEQAVTTNNLRPDDVDSLVAALTGDHNHDGRLYGNGI